MMSYATRDGVKLYYEEAGVGEPPILLVHGWTCDHTYFAPQFGHFSTNHRVVAVDLRGHGQSDKPEQDYAPSIFADDLAWLSGELGLGKPVVIGHSLGGVIAMELAVRHPELPAAVVLLDAPIVWPPDGRALAEQLIPAFQSPGYREVQRGFIEAALFAPTDNPLRKAHIVEMLCSTPQYVLTSSYEEMLNWDGAAAAQACRVPVLNLSSARSPNDSARLTELCPQVVHGQTVGAGHFNQLEVPDQVNAMIDRFLTVGVPRPAASP
jgi:pimeloyl-ACP methyl ester carboxylesterase